MIAGTVLVSLLASVWASPPPPALRSHRVASGLTRPVAFALAPDGAAYVCEQGGRLRVVRGGRLAPRAVVQLAVDDRGECGLLGVAVDREFSRTRRLFLVYTPAASETRVTVASLEVAADTMRAGSLKVLFRGDPLAGTVHAGGAIAIDRSGCLLVGIGDGDDERAAASLHSSQGKLLRIHRDGRIPSDNPLLRVTQGAHRAIWARGLRNPFTIGVHPRSGRVHVNDVGHESFEEVNEPVAGAHLGWPLFEGPSAHAGYLPPRHAYPHAEGCCITAGGFYASEHRSLPLPWRDGWFFSDFCTGDLRWLSPGPAGRIRRLGPLPSPGPVAMAVAADGALWVLARGAVEVSGAGGATGTLDRIVWTEIVLPGGAERE